MKRLRQLWTRFFRRGLSVGQVTGRLPALNAAERALRRAVLPDGKQPEEWFRETLDDEPAIEIVDDALGAIHEGVPYESLVFMGPYEVAESLKMALPRFFAPIAFRALDFQFHHIPTTGTPMLLFGDMLEARLGRPRGIVEIYIDKRIIETVAPDGGTGSPYYLKGGQGRAVIALAPEPVGGSGVETTKPPPWIGLPFFKISASSPAKALVITPLSGLPRVQLWMLNEVDDDVTSVLGKRLGDDATVVCDLQYEVFDAAVPGEAGLPAGARLRIVPDTQFSRPIPSRRDAQGDQLEIVGVFVPDPAHRPGITAAAVRFDAGQRLMSHGLRTEHHRVILDGRLRFVHQTEKGRAAIGRDGAVPDFALKLPTQGSMEDTKGLGGDWTLVKTSGPGSMGWIPLKFGLLMSDQQLAPDRAGLEYLRAMPVRASEAGEKGDSIYLDWLDQAVRLIATDGEGDTVETGLANWCARQADQLRGELALIGGRLFVPHTKNAIDDRGEFRLGPLLVRYHRAPR